MNRAAARQRVAGVDHQVEDDLFQVVRIDEHGALLFEIHRQLDVLADHARQHVAEGGDCRTELDARDARIVLAPERQQLPGQRGAALGRAPNLCRGRPHQVVLALVEEDVGVAHRDLEQVVEIVRDARGELPDHFHLLRAAYLLLRRAYIFERRAQFGLAGAEGSGCLVPAVNQAASDERDRRKDCDRTAFQGKPPEGNASGVPATTNTIVSSPARPFPQWVATATAANTGANGAKENSGHVTRVTATLVRVTRTARP